MLSNKRCDLRQNYATYKRDGLGKLQVTSWHSSAAPRQPALDLALTCNEAQGVDRAIPQVQPGALDQTFPAEKSYDATVIFCHDFTPAFPSSNSGAKQRPNPLISCSCPDSRKKPLPQWPSHWPLKHLTVGQHSPFAMASWAQHPVVILPGPQLHWPNARLPVVSVGKLWSWGIWWNHRKGLKPFLLRDCSKIKLLLASMKLGECEVATFLP